MSSKNCCVCNNLFKDQDSDESYCEFHLKIKNEMGVYIEDGVLAGAFHAVSSALTEFIQNKRLTRRKPSLEILIKQYGKHYKKEDRDQASKFFNWEEINKFMESK